MWVSLDTERAESLAATHGTPLYVFDRTILSARLEVLRVALGAKVLYAVKANPHPEVLSALAGHVDGFDLASEGELDAVLRTPRAPGRTLSVAGPAKTGTLLARAVELDAVINLESFRELEVVCREARRLGRPARARLRINSATAFRAYRLQMTGGPSPFGFDEETLDEVLPRVATAVRAKELELEGVHLHPGSQGTSAGGFLAVLSTGFALLERVRKELGVEAPSLNLGGGFGVIAPGDELDVMALKERVADQLARFIRAAGPVSLWVEPGRWLAGPAGLYVTRVVSEKRSRGAHFTVLDGGVHQHFAHAAWLLPPKASRAPVLNLSRPEAPQVTRTLVGALCTPLDTFGEVTLPEPCVGDLLAFQGAGAYGLTFSPFAFLSHRPPLEVFL